ncbi:hypothetical protein Bca52824_004278 [Brassica carinata]|uniref:Uncharacterized protein n=1 Tax=Brassica carinata TaxID=52824 RepID=A0A8X8BFZ8_BRACI|nr:hypothetical protein Bca52824_004278 [Brassica carinata]
MEINLNEYMQCYCGVCDKPAPCAQWMPSHCNASADSFERKSPTLETTYYKTFMRVICSAILSLPGRFRFSFPELVTQKMMIRSRSAATTAARSLGYLRHSSALVHSPLLSVTPIQDTFA